MCGIRRSNLCKTQAYWAFRSLYSLVLSACVTPSMESTTGHAKSYVGYIFHSGARWWLTPLTRYRTGSRIALLVSFILILARKQNRAPLQVLVFRIVPIALIANTSSDPVFIKANNSWFLSTVLFRSLLSVPIIRSSLMTSWVVPSTYALPSAINFSASSYILSKWSEVYVVWSGCKPI